MRSRWHTIPTLLVLPACISALTLDCSHLRVDKQSFDLSKLGGPKTVHDLQWERPSIENNTYTIDICDPLKQPDLDREDRCPSGTRVCGQKWIYRNKIEPFIERAIPIAGEYASSNGRGMEPKLTRLKGSSQNSEDKEGVMVELHGGKYPNERSGKPQKAIVEFLCDKSVSGNEGFEDADKKMLHRRANDDDEDDEGPDLPNLDKGKQLKFISYKDEGENQVLRLRWKTKYACEGAKDNPDPDDEDDDKKTKSSGWGFFTWFIIIVFLLAATYIIFGSWLNYNRYGARGWDLIPHGDTLRDIPYIVKDLGSNVADRVRGGGDSRGGYSAV